jgi:predicted metal-binding protein
MDHVPGHKINLCKACATDHMEYNRNQNREITRKILKTLGN